MDPPEILSLDEELEIIADSTVGFAGLWVDSAKIFVAFVDTVNELHRAASLQEIRSLISASPGELRHASGLPFVLRDAKYLFKDLHRWRQAYDASATQSAVVFTDTDERRNTVSVGIAAGASSSAIESRLREIGLPSDAIRIVEVPWPSPTTTLVDEMTPTAGGSLVYVTWSEGGLGKAKGGTITGNVIWLAGNPTEDYFVTCAHCTAKAFKPDPAATWYQADLFDPVMTGAQEVADPLFFSGGSCPSGKVCRWSEAAIVKYGSAGAKWYPQVAWAPNPYTLQITNLYLIDQTQTIGNSWYYKTGAASGSSGGVVTQSCVTFTPNYASYMTRGDTLPSNSVFLCQSWADYSSMSGDSGGPVFQIPNSPPSPTSVTMRGVHHAGSTGTPSVFSPISGINKDFGTVRWDLY